MERFVSVKQVLETLFKKTPFHYPIRKWLRRQRWLQQRQVRNWIRGGKLGPAPYLVKQATLKHYANQYRLHILVETGTYYGDMIDAMKDQFDQIYSIELGQRFYEKAKQRFKSVSHVELILGDSGKELRKVLRKIGAEPALFWLDGHYLPGSARGDQDTPIYEELDQIFDAPNSRHVIIIDDARCFGSDPAYPTMTALEAYILAKRSNVCITVQDDMIRIIPDVAANMDGKNRTGK